MTTGAAHLLRRPEAGRLAPGAAADLTIVRPLAPCPYDSLVRAGRTATFLRLAMVQESKRFAPRVREHFMGGVHSGVNGTPTFFINGVRHDGGFDYQSLLEAINEQL